MTGGRANAGTLLTTPVPDRDGDGTLDELDSCPDHVDPTFSDADGDGLGDPCDPTPRGDDADGDSKALLDDRCPSVYSVEPDGCPRVIVNPPNNPPQPPNPTPDAEPDAVADGLPRPWPRSA